MRNAWNHPPKCGCGWGGETGNSGVLLPLTTPTGAFQTQQSYVNANAICPVCRANVFFYQSPFGGKVFFDDLGWPWPKHGCTDNPQAQKGRLKLVPIKGAASFRHKSGEILKIYHFLDLTEDQSGISLRVYFKNKLEPIRLPIPYSKLAEIDIKAEDLRNAPSFVIRTYANHRIVEFIAGRKQAVVTFDVARPRPQK